MSDLVYWLGIVVITIVMFAAFLAFFARMSLPFRTWVNVKVRGHRFILFEKGEHDFHLPFVASLPRDVEFPYKSTDKSLLELTVHEDHAVRFGKYQWREIECPRNPFGFLNCYR